VDNSNPAYASSQNKTSRITLTPTEAASKTNTSLGAIGVMVNGAYFYNAWDAHSYNNQNIWQQNANTVEAVSFDTGPGHAAPGQNAQPSSSTPGQYHYHQAPTALLNQIDAGNTGQRHSPILGYAFDGFPIYGPYGYVDPTNPNSGIKRITSSYQVRADISSSGLRHSTTDGGSTLPTNQWGPNVSTQYPAGYYLQDYEYVSGLGDLNQYNMRWTVTPDYPQGTWAYFVTLDNSGAAAYPYIVGPQYFGVVDSADIGPTGGQVAIPGSARELTLGDADLDGTVDGADLAALASHWQGHADWAGGDFNRDGIVDITDLYLLAQNWQGAPESMSQLLAAVEAQSSVPEPGLAMGMLLPMLLITRRRGSHNSTRRE
jgi:hypothetical protein